VEPDAQLRDGSSVSGGSVVLASGERVPYDWLVVALGAEPDPRGVPGGNLLLQQQMDLVAWPLQQ
jgi:NADPH-dependent 2,4-dienoyl-CoA reductase/sulfur reductase-like enzyme